MFRKTAYDWRKWGVVALSMGILWLPAVGFAQDQSAGAVGYFPEGLTGKGCIDSITATNVVIDDSAYELAAGVSYRSLKSEYASRALFRPGTQVGYLTNSDKQIDSLWYLGSCK
jgi:hypothetical protein